METLRGDEQPMQADDIDPVVGGGAGLAVGLVVVVRRVVVVVVGVVVVVDVVVVAIGLIVTDKVAESSAPSLSRTVNLTV